MKTQLFASGKSLNEFVSELQQTDRIHISVDRDKTGDILLYYLDVNKGFIPNREKIYSGKVAGYNVVA
jgi:hypothetical protein